MVVLRVSIATVTTANARMGSDSPAATADVADTRSRKAAPV